MRIACDRGGVAGGPQLQQFGCLAQRHVRGSQSAQSAPRRSARSGDPAMGEGERERGLSFRPIQCVDVTGVPPTPSSMDLTPRQQLLEIARPPADDYSTLDYSTAYARSELETCWTRSSGCSSASPTAPQQLSPSDLSRCFDGG